MKNAQSGKIFILGLLICCVATAVVLNKVFKDSGSYKSMATEQMRLEFLSYVALKSPDQMQVANLNGLDYFASLKASWSFALNDKTLMIRAPELTPIPAPELKTQVHEMAQKSIAEAAKTWLQDKFHTQKDLLVDVSF